LKRNKKEESPRSSEGLTQELSVNVQSIMSPPEEQMEFGLPSKFANYDIYKKSITSNPYIDSGLASRSNEPMYPVINV
jgi:hypothetical protein